jgi:5-methylthioadenosine/S-adenosylhomocysteine deaminase
MLKLLDNCRYLTPDGQVVRGRIAVLHDMIQAVLEPGQEPATPPALILDLENRVVFPGLINAHDHLIDSFWPPVGNGPYASWEIWEAELKQSEQFRAMQHLSVADLYALGMYRNLLSGVTLIVDHFPAEVNGPFRGKPHVSLLEHFFLAHSPTAGSHDWGRNIEEEFRQARGVLPFLLHAAEGFSPQVREDIELLNRLGVLADNTVLITGVGLQEADVELIAAKHVSLIWCPVASQHLYHHQPPIRALRQQGVRLAIGTNSAVSGSVNLFEDLRCARAFAQADPDLGLTDLDLISMVTSQAAALLRIDKQHGAIAPGKFANLLVFEDPAETPFDRFFSLAPSDLSMVIHQGSLVYGDERFRSACSIEVDNFGEVLVDGVPKILFGKALQLLDRIEYKLGRTDHLPFLPITGN